VLVLLLISSGCIETLWYELKPMEKETFQIHLYNRFGNGSN
ncbi:hypothetical protein LCGC14_2992330, partial [marine sediment metagenome]